MKFSLSNSQQKSLLIRGQPLQIALPMDRSEVDDLDQRAALQHAAEMLILPAGTRLDAAVVDELDVAPPVNRATPQTLTEWIGAIVDPEQTPAWLICRHVVIIATIQGPAVRHPAADPQWPGGKLVLPQTASSP